MSNVHFNRSLDRRTVLRGAGVAMSLPWISAMRPAFAGKDSIPPQRFVAMTLGLGLLPENLNPKQAGRDYAPSRYLQPLQDLRSQFGEQKVQAWYDEHREFNADSASKEAQGPS